MKQTRKKQTNLTHQEKDQRTGFDAEAVRRQAEEYALQCNLAQFIEERIGEADDGEALRINRWGSEYGPKWEDYRIQIVGTVLQIFDQPKTIEPFEFDFPCTIVDSAKLVKIQRIRILHRETDFYCDAPYTGTSFGPTLKGSGDVWRQGQMAIDKQFKLLRRGLPLLGFIPLKPGRKKRSKTSKPKPKRGLSIVQIEKAVGTKLTKSKTAVISYRFLAKELGFGTTTIRRVIEDPNPNETLAGLVNRIRRTLLNPSQKNVPRK